MLNQNTDALHAIAGLSTLAMYCTRGAATPATVQLALDALLSRHPDCEVCAIVSPHLAQVIADSDLRGKMMVLVSEPVKASSTEDSAMLFVNGAIAPHGAGIADQSRVQEIVTPRPYMPAPKLSIDFQPRDPGSAVLDMIDRIAAPEYERRYGLQVGSPAYLATDGGIFVVGCILALDAESVTLGYYEWRQTERGSQVLTATERVMGTYPRSQLAPSISVTLVSDAEGRLLRGRRLQQIWGCWTNSDPEPAKRVEDRRRALRSDLSFELTDRQWDELWCKHDALACAVTER